MQDSNSPSSSARSGAPEARDLKSSTSKLSQLQDKFLGFERQMELEAKQRRESEESRLASLRENMVKLEKTLNAEIKRRVDANKALQGMFESQIVAVQDKLEGAFNEKIDQLQTAFSSISERVGFIERDFSIERERYVRDIEDKNALVARDVNSLQHSFENDRVLRAEKEGLLVRRLGELESKTASKLEQERASRDARMQSFRETLSECLKMKDRGDEKFQTFALEEIAALKNGIILESQSREQADDDIVQALNHYTKALQDALRIANSV